MIDENNNNELDDDELIEEDEVEIYSSGWRSCVQTAEKRRWRGFWERKERLYYTPC